MTSWCSSRLLLPKPSSEPSNVRRDVSWAKCLHKHVLPGCQLTFSKFPSSQRLSNDLQHFLRYSKPTKQMWFEISIHRCPRQRWVWFLKPSLKRKSIANLVVLSLIHHINKKEYSNVFNEMLNFVWPSMKLLCTSKCRHYLPLLHFLPLWPAFVIQHFLLPKILSLTRI